MTSEYNQLPSSAIDSIVFDHEKNQVKIMFKNGKDFYKYSTENTREIEKEFLAEFKPQPDEDTFSVGRWFNSNINAGKFTLLTE